MLFEFTEESKQEIIKIKSKYPENNNLSPIMPVLTLAQKQNGGYLTKEIISYVANYLKVSEIAVYSVASFYSMYQLSPVGKFNIKICNSVVCNVKGSQDIYKYCKHITNTLNSDISSDGLFSVQKVECLGACVNAIAIKINDVFYEDITKEGIKEIIEDLQNGNILKGTKNIKISQQYTNKNISNENKEGIN